MKVFVTGGAGFIGSNLSRSMAGAGHDVTIYDNLSNSSEGMVPAGVRLVVGDIRDADALVEASAGHDVMVHLAAQIYVQRSVENPAETASINVEGSRNVADACVKNGIGMVAASSAAIFGDACGEDTLDESSRCSPLSPYGQSKLDMENILRNSGLDCIILRFFNIYGPGLTSEYAGVITKFAGFIRGNKEIIVYGDGEQTRDFISIDDVVRAIELAISNVNGKKETYNIGTGTSTSINGLAKIMLEMSGSNGRIIHRDHRPGDIMFGSTSVQKAQRELGFAPRISLKDGIEKYWDSF